MSKGLKILKWILVGALFVVLFGFITMELWNWLLPGLLNAGRINFWQALGLLLLCKILFGGFAGKRWGNHGVPYWRHRYYEKLSGMSPEERERFKARLRAKWCPPDRSTPGEK